MMNSLQQQDGLKRGLKNRHMQLIALGGAIGTGLFLGSASVLKAAGPSMILGYATFGIKGVVFPLLVRAIGVVGSIISTYSVRAGENDTSDTALHSVHRGFLIGSVISVIGFFVLGFGYLHFDADTDEAWAEQLTSETVVYRQVLGRRVRMWKPKRTGTRQEALDCTVYAYAAMVGRGGAELLDRRASRAPRTASETPPAAAEPDEKPDAAPEPAPGAERTLESTPEGVKVTRPKPPRRGGWMRNRFR